MGETALKIDFPKLISYCDDLVGVLNNRKDINNLMQTVEGVKLLQSSCDVDFSEVHTSLEVYQKKINECQQRINDAKSEVGDDTELDSLQKEFEEELKSESSLREELRIISDKINDLEHQRVSLEERKQNLKKVEKDELREQRKLSMYASVTNIIPNLDSETKISGHIVDKEKRIVEMFEYETTNSSSSSLEICNKLWKKINM